MQLILNILHFFWELVMQKSTPGDGKPSKSEKWRKLILFLTIAALIVYSTVITERLYRITRSFIDLAKEMGVQKTEMVELIKEITALKDAQSSNSACQMLLNRTQSNLELCLTRKQPTAPVTPVFPLTNP